MKSNLKIALYYNLPSGGAKRATFEEISRLSKRHSFDLFLIFTADKDFCDISKFINKTSFIEYSQLKKFKFPFSRLNWIIQFIDLCRLELILKKLAKKINEGNYDLCFLTTCQFTDISLIIRYIKIPTVFYCHSVAYPEYIIEARPYLKSKFPLLRRFIPDLGQIIFNKIMEKKKSLNIKKASLILTNSFFMKELLFKKYNVLSKVNYLGVDTDKFIPMPVISKENFILSVGALEAWKAYDFIIESLAYIEESKRPSLTIAYHLGNEQEKCYLTNLAKNLKVNITFIKVANIVELYNKTRVFCFAALYEPFGLVALEAMACAIPVIGVNEGGICEAIIHNKTGFLVSRDHKEFAGKIEFLLENKDIAEKYGQQGRRYVLDNWSWEKSVAELERCFYDVIKNK